MTVISKPCSYPKRWTKKWGRYTEKPFQSLSCS